MMNTLLLRGKVLVTTTPSFVHRRLLPTVFIPSSSSSSLPLVLLSSLKASPPSVIINRPFSASSSSSSSNIIITNSSSLDNDSSSPPPAGTIMDDDQQTREEKIHELQSLAAMHHSKANYAAALECAEEALEHCINLFEEKDDSSSSDRSNNDTASIKHKHPATAAAHVNVGLMKKEIGNYDEASNHYFSALRIYKKSVGVDHASYAATLHNLGNLERARASSHESNDDDGDESSDNNNGSSQNKMSAFERMAANERAVEMLSEALQIRQMELGKNHPRTVSTLSCLGGAVSSLVVRSEVHRINSNRTDSSAEGSPKGKSNNKGRPMSKLTGERWKLAEDYLRDALKTAVKHPRGEQVRAPNNPNLIPKIKEERDIIELKEGEDGSKGGKKEGKVDHDTDKPKLRMSKKEKRGMAKELRREKKRAQAVVLEKEAMVKKKEGIASKNDDDTNSKTNVDGDLSSSTSPSSSTSVEDEKRLKEIVGYGDPSVVTLSAASSAQNLAVFLKSRSDLLLADDSATKTTAISNNNNDNSSTINVMREESLSLYSASLRVRMALRGKAHPETIATKFSLASLLEVMGNEKSANVLREQILNSYDVVEKVEEG